MPQPDATDPPTLDYASRPPQWSAEQRRALAVGCATTLVYFAAVIGVLILTDLAIHAAWAWWHASS